jgi:hypothetical protein
MKFAAAYVNKQHDVYLSVSQNKIKRFTDKDYEEMAELYKYLRKIKDKSKRCN